MKADYHKTEFASTRYFNLGSFHGPAHGHHDQRGDQGWGGRGQEQFARTPLQGHQLPAHEWADDGAQSAHAQFSTDAGRRMILCLYESGSKEKPQSYTAQLTLARFNYAWLIDGKEGRKDGPIV